MSASIATSRSMMLAQQRLAAGQADLLDAVRPEDPRQPRDFLERQQLGVRQERVIVAEDVLAACSRRSGNCSGRSPKSAGRASCARAVSASTPVGATAAAPRAAASVAGKRTRVGERNDPGHDNACFDTAIDDVSRRRAPLHRYSMMAARATIVLRSTKKAMPALRFPVAVVIERIPLANRWASEQWRVGAVERDDSPLLVAGQAFRRRERHALALHRISLELHPSESEGYFLNITAPDPKIFVMWRMLESERVTADGLRARPELVTVSYNEAARLMDGGEMVDALPLLAGCARMDAAVCRGELQARAEAQGSPQRALRARCQAARRCRGPRLRRTGQGNR